MPNHITNIILMDGIAKDIVKCCKYVQGEESGFDFEKLIPMPAHIYRGNLSGADEEKYGKENCWHWWSVKNWGTKWNAYAVNNDGQGYISFNTAWSTPEPIFKALSKKFPKIKFTIRFADEDFGSNCGEIVAERGKLSIYRPEDQSKEANAFAAEVLGYDPREEEEEE